MTPTLAQALAPRWYTVLSPTWKEVDPVLDDGSGPSETIRDMLMIRATSGQRAKVLALRAWRRRVFDRYTWRPGKAARNRRLDIHSFRRKPDFLYAGENPFRGMSVKRATQDEIDYVLHGKEDECPLT